MAVDQSVLRRLGAYASLQKSIRIVEQASAKHSAFLCHSHKDQALAKGVQKYLQDGGWSVYIDWEDQGMPEKPDGQTAERIRKRIRELDWLIFLATANSVVSKWCPWEIGYADGAKGPQGVLVLQTRDDGGQNHGNEYLQLYRRVEVSSKGPLGAFDSADQGFLLSEAVRP